MRSGVDANLRSVSARALGPKNGRHPIVAVIATTSNTTSTETIHPVIFNHFTRTIYHTRWRIKLARFGLRSGGSSSETPHKQ